MKDTKNILKTADFNALKYLTDYGIKLYNKPSELCVQSIAAVSREKLANEYADKIAFFDKEKIALSNRLIPPYITTETHGKDVFDDLYQLVKDLGSKSILDLGCGAGEFLYELSKRGYTDIFGCTIHLGEREYAKNNYKIKSVLPLDMREIDWAFLPSSLNLIVAHCCLHFLVKEDRQKVLQAAEKILKRNGFLAVIDYKFNKDTGLEVEQSDDWEIIYPVNYNLMGNLTLFRKI